MHQQNSTKPDMFPIRCFTCNKVLADKYGCYKASKDKKKTLKQLKINRFCCRRMFIAHVDAKPLISEEKLYR